MVTVTDFFERTITSRLTKIKVSVAGEALELTNTDGQVFFISADEAVEVLEALLAFAREHGPDGGGE